MGNHISHRPSDDSGRVILADGTVETYEKPLTVAELMLDHPQQVVVEFQTLTNGKKPTPLAADMKLEAGKVYMMLPMRRGKPVAAAMSAEEARRILLRANVVLNSNSFSSAYTGFLPLFARMCPMADKTAVKKTKGEELEVKSQEMWKSELFREVDIDMEERGDYYLSRQLSGKGVWKPSLDTIKEKGVKAKIRHWLL